MCVCAESEKVNGVAFGFSVFFLDLSIASFGGCFVYVFVVGSHPCVKILYCTINIYVTGKCMVYEICENMLLTWFMRNHVSTRNK